MNKGRFSQYGSRYLLGLLLAPDAFPELAGFHVALTSGVPSDTDNGTTIDEPLGEFGYSRASVPSGYEYWSLRSQYGTFANSEEIVFPVANSVWDVRGFALLTSSVGGEVLAYGPSTISRVATGMRVTIPPGGIVLTMRGASL